MTVREIASFLDGDAVGNASLEIAGIAKIEDAKAGELTFLSNPKYKNSSSPRMRRRSSSAGRWIFPNTGSFRRRSSGLKMRMLLL